MSNQTWNNDPDKPDGSGEGQDSGGYNPPGYAAPDQGTPAPTYDPSGQNGSAPSGTDAPQQGGYQPPSWDAGQPAPSGASGTDAPQQGGYQPPSWDPGQQPAAPSGADAPQGGYSAPGYGQGYSAPSGGDPSGYGAPGYGQVPSTPDQTFGQTPSYGAPTQDAYGQAPGYGQPPAGQGGYDPNAGGYGQAPYGGAPQGQGGYDPNAGPYGQPGPYGDAPQQGGYGAPGSYGAPSPYGGGYQPNPYAPSGPVLATWGRRAIGGLIDFVVPGVVVSILMRLILPDGGTVASIIQLLLVLGWWVYNSGYRVAATGYSFGHKIGKVRVVMEDTGQTPPQNTAILRAAAHFLDSLVCALGFLFPLWDAKKQTFADKIAKTVVIDEQHVQR